MVGCSLAIPVLLLTDPRRQADLKASGKSSRAGEDGCEEEAFLTSKPPPPTCSELLSYKDCMIATATTMLYKEVMSTNKWQNPPNCN
ncbi:hypothetical protein I7I50_02756 [Histoplasma capsulatum G186AR]|uniref:Uncharacterized protein n=1 Tax=Ajellomyces capsulatus TaxID=5037 RepID=A0A8H7Z7T3_AJECA|nr:hypothetical protein I7I52_00578 [Histoplasma capsulatum]QSS71780.1 hypothetical protein I7I50_02756 [Histoplasma capsulatum G186AR]